MNRIKMYRLCRILYFIIFSCLAFGCSTKDSPQHVRAHSIRSPLVAEVPLAPGDFVSTLVPTRKQSLTCIEIIDQFRHRHYRRVIVDDQLSSKIFDRYLSDLDNSRSYFLSQDLSEFEVYRYRLDDTLKGGELGPAFKIFNRYQQRAVERLVFMINRIELGFENMAFDIDESIETDRENAPWAANTAELDELWRKRLKNEVLSLKLAGDSIDKIRKSLSRRYRSRLNRVSQTNGEDAFAVYINAVGGDL